MLLNRDAGLALLCERLNQAMENCAAMTDDTDLVKRLELMEKMEDAIGICMAYLRLKQRKWLSRGGVNAVKAITTQERLHLREEGTFFHDLLREKTQVKLALAGLGANNERQVVIGRRVLKPRGRWLKKAM